MIEEIVNGIWEDTVICWSYNESREEAIKRRWRVIILKAVSDTRSLSVANIEKILSEFESVKLIAYRNIQESKQQSSQAMLEETAVIGR